MSELYSFMGGLVFRGVRSQIVAEKLLLLTDSDVSRKSHSIHATMARYGWIRPRHLRGAGPQSANALSTARRGLLETAATLMPMIYACN